MKRSISVVVPVYNEEKNINEAVRAVTHAVATFSDYEIIIVNDGSTDGTGEVIAKLAKQDKHILVVTHAKNMGIGSALRDGIVAATKDYVTQFHGDNDSSGESMRLMLKEIGKADIISSYSANPQSRAIPRRIISKGFVALMNGLFGLHLRYYTGFFICRTKILKSLSLASNGFAFYPEAKVRLIKSGATYIEVPFIHTGRRFGSSKAISIPSAWETISTVIRLWIDIYIRRTAGVVMSKPRGS